MILSVLKFVVTVVVAIISITLKLVQVVFGLAADSAKAGMAATPGTIEALKAHAAQTASKAGPVAAKFDTDARKMLKLHKSAA